MSLLLLASFFFVSNAYYTVQVCPPNAEVCVIQGNSSMVAIADKTVNTLEVICDGIGICQPEGLVTEGLIVYSSANNTLIECIGKDSCGKTNYFYGLTPPSKFGTFNPLSFEGGIKETANMVCIGEQACKEIKSNVTGNIKQGFRIEAPVQPGISNPSIIKGSLMKAEIYCNTALCTLGCTDDIKSDTCKDTKCLETNPDSCNCLGVCPLDLNIPNVPSPVPQPTAPVVPLPTYRPTPEPTDNRTTVNCVTDPCNLTPEENWDINCGERVEECNVLCPNPNACQDGVIIETRAAFTNLECRQKNGCDKVILYVLGGREVTINCYDEISCSHMQVVVESPLTVVNLNIFGTEGFAYGGLFCNGICNLLCQGRDSCKNAKTECGTSSTNCKCLGDYCQGNELIPFGDMSCKGQEERCVIDGLPDLRVVADKTVNELIINCNGPEKCKKMGEGLRIFSAALTTKIDCGSNGCEEILMYVGNLKGNKVPKGFSSSDFERDFSVGLGQPVPEQTATISCINNGACKKAVLYYSDSVSFANIIGSGDDALMNADLECEGCGRLQVSCPPYTGCLGAAIECTNPTNCQCIPIEPEITPDPNTTAPAIPLRINTCPEIVNPLANPISMKKGGINNGYGNKVTGNVENSMKILIPLGIVVAVVMFCFIAVWFNWNKNYKKLNDFDNGLSKNEKIYDAYNVEMH